MSEQSFPGKSKKMRARWAGVDENIGPKMCWKLVNDVSREIICRSTICSAIKPGTANLQVDPIEPKPVATSMHDDKMLDEFMSLVDFFTPFSRTSEKEPDDSISVSTKSKTWENIEKGQEHPEDTQQRFSSHINSRVKTNSTGIPLDQNQEKLM